MKKNALTKAVLVCLSTMALVACGGGSGQATTAAPETTTQTEVTTAETTEVSTEETTGEVAEGAVKLQIGQAEAAAHGDKSFAIATAVIDQDGKIVASYIDEYQFLTDDQTGVPNSEAFTESGDIASGNVLASKRVNNAYYSELMKKAGATKEIAANFDGIQEYAVGKTIGELEELAGKPAADVADAVSGATLADTSGYIQAIADAAKEASDNQAVSFDGDISTLTLNRIEAAAHGDKCFAVASALTDGTNVILSYIDEYQFLTNDTTGIPNSEAFAASGTIAEGKVLASKRVNNTYYSEYLKTAGATKEISANFDGIQEYVNGKSIAELEELVGKPAEEVVDAVSGATLVDTQGYIAAILEAAK